MPYTPYDSSELEKELEKEIADLENVNSNLLNTLVQHVLTEIGEVDESLRELVNKLVVSSVGLALEKLNEIQGKTQNVRTKLDEMESKRKESETGKNLNNLLNKAGVDYDAFLDFINNEMSLKQQKQLANLPLEQQVEAVIKLMNENSSTAGAPNLKGKYEDVDNENGESVVSIFRRD